MATTKSTVLGIRLDHDRRAWVEGEAARRGVSVRALFEGMIDGARTGETADADRAIAGLGSAAPGAGATEHEAEAPAEYSPQEPTEEQTEGVHTSQPTPLERDVTLVALAQPRIGHCHPLRSDPRGLLCDHRPDRVDQPVCDQEGGGVCVNAGSGTALGVNTAASCRTRAHHTKLCGLLGIVSRETPVPSGVVKFRMAHMLRLEVFGGATRWDPHRP